ncbi:MAG: PQQ-dependent sugar dehydrogenase [Chthoniobacterales bacterium]|nr:PQQ-dependent sugar dehydrogenase [Chthoniobacterales bacterium]
MAAALCTQSHAQLPSIGTGTISVELQTIATGLNSPVELVSANDGTGRLFVVEQGGRIKILNSGAVVTTPFLDVSARIVAGGERGLLGLAFHPEFNQPASPGFGKLYTYTSEPVTGAADFSDNSASDHQSVITEWQVSATNPDVVDPASRREVMRIDQPQSNHNGGKIAFRPSDGYLYIALGDGGASNDVGTGHTPNLGNAQDVNNVLGDILRIDPLDPASTLARSDPPSLNAKYRVPATNPFIGAIVGVDEIFAYGFRNPYRFSFDPVTDQLIVGDVGQGAIEEVDIVEPGKNYGWNRKEGSFLFNPSNGSVSPDQSPNPAYVNPVLEYDHDDGISVIGGFVYRGSAVPALSGKYVFGDFLRRSTGNGRLFYGDFDKRVIQELRIGINPRSFSGNIKGIGIDSSDELYVVGDGNSGGQVLKVVPIPASPALVNLSTRARIETGENVLIAGFILTGSAPKNIVLRGIGPSLSVDGQPVAGRMMNPTVSLFDGSGSLIGTNNDWPSSSRSPELSQRGLAPPDPRESADIVVLEPGAYTAVMSGVNGDTGIGLVELYDIDQGAAGNAVNISTRGRVLIEPNVMIGGFIIGSGQSQRLLARAIGPSLSGRGVAGALQDPTLEIVNASGTPIAFNDNWRSDQATEITNSQLAPSNDAESAIVRTLSPGNYTAIVRGAANTTGVALVEVYRLSP